MSEPVIRLMVATLRTSVEDLDDFYGDWTAGVDPETLALIRSRGWAFTEQSAMWKRLAADQGEKAS